MLTLCLRLHLYVNQNVNNLMDVVEIQVPVVLKNSEVAGGP